jgi:hypothetical protein
VELVSGETIDVSVTNDEDAAIWCIGLRSLVIAGSASRAADVPLRDYILQFRQLGDVPCTTGVRGLHRCTENDHSV